MKLNIDVEVPESVAEAYRGYLRLLIGHDDNDALIADILEAQVRDFISTVEGGIRETPQSAYRLLMWTLGDHSEILESS